MNVIINHKILPTPEKPHNIPNNSYWLSGEGCGSWFSIEDALYNYEITRYSPEGKIECKGIFKQTIGIPINLKEKYEFTYLSHCAEINIIQQNNKLQFKLITKL